MRYVDDFVLFHDCKSELRQWEEAIRDFLITCRLKLNPCRVHLYPATERMRFLGQVVSRTRRRLPGENVRRFRRRLQKWRKCPPENMDQRIASWLGHAKQANTMGLLRTLSRSNLPTFHARSQ